MFTSDPTIDRWLLAQAVVVVGMPLLGNCALVVVSAVRARHVPGTGWLWLLAAGLFGLFDGFVGPIVGMASTTYGARLGTTEMIQLQAGTAIVSSLLGSVWWVLLVVGIATMRGQRAP